MDYLSTGEGCTVSPWMFYPLGRGVHSLRGLFIHWRGVYTPSVGLLIHWKGVYTSSVDYLSTGEGCTLPLWIIYPLEWGVHFLRALFIH